MPVQQGNMNLCASPSCRERRKQRQLRKSMAGVAKRAKLRIERAKECGEWTRRTITMEASFSPDGMFISLRFADDSWSRSGSERYVRGQLARKLWSMKQTEGN